MRKTVHVVPHQHFDLVWRREVDWYVQRRAEIYRQALGMLQEYPEFTFTFSQALPIRMFLKDHPGFRADFAAHLKSGRLEIIGGCETICDLNMTSPAAIMDNIESGLKYFRDEFDYQVTTGGFEDAFGVPAQLPAILNTVGYRFYKAGRMPRPGKPDLCGDFIWRAKSGDAIRCIAPEAGNSDWGWGYPDNPDDPNPVTIRDRRKKMLAKLLGAANNIASEVFYFITGEEHDIITGLPELLRQAAATTGAEYIFSTCARYYDSLPRKHWKKAPVYGADTDFARLFTGCYTSRIDSKLDSRKLEYRIAGHDFRSLTGAETELLPQVRQALFTMQFHDAVCGCHIDENFAMLAAHFNQSSKLIPAKTPLIPFKRQLPTFEDEIQQELDPTGENISFGDFTIHFIDGQLRAVEYDGKDYGAFCELAAREDNGTLWTEEYSGRNRKFGDYEELEYISAGENSMHIVTNLLYDDFRAMWPGFSTLQARKELIFAKDSPWVSVKFEIFWLGSATELAVRWLVAGKNLGRCVTEIPFGSQARTACVPAPDTMTGDAFPVSNWCRTGNAAIINRGTPGHALRDGGLETIILRSPVKRWSPWFPVTPSEQAQDNGIRKFEFVIDLNGGKRRLADLHRAGIEYNLGDNVEQGRVALFDSLPENIVIAGAERDHVGKAHALLFESEGCATVWNDRKFRIKELFKPYQIKKIVLYDTSEINFVASLGERRRAVSPVA